MFELVRNREYLQMFTDHGAGKMVAFYLDKCIHVNPLFDCTHCSSYQCVCVCHDNFC